MVKVESRGANENEPISVLFLTDALEGGWKPNIKRSPVYYSRPHGRDAIAFIEIPNYIPAVFPFIFIFESVYDPAAWKAVGEWREWGPGVWQKKWREFHELRLTGMPLEEALGKL